MLTTVFQATGVQTNTNKLSVQAGGLVQADNCVIDKKDVIELRRGFNPVGTAFAFAGDADNLYVFPVRAARHRTAPRSLRHRRQFLLEPVWGRLLRHLRSRRTNAAKIHAVEGVNSNFYFTTSHWCL
jgi:hypothetical protein